MKATYKGKEEERRHHIDLDLLKYSFAPDKTFRFVLKIHKFIKNKNTINPGALGVDLESIQLHIYRQNLALI